MKNDTINQIKREHAAKMEASIPYTPPAKHRRMPIGHDPEVRERNEAEARVIYQRLLTCDPGELITYAALTKLAGRDVQNGARSAMMKARRQAGRDHGLVFGTVQDEGLRLLLDNEVLERHPSYIKRQVRAARRRENEILTVELEDLDADTKTAALTQLAQTAGIRHFLSEASTGRLEAVTRQKAIIDGAGAPSMHEVMAATLETMERIQKKQ